MTGESAYLFRHALLRDAAYQLQLPGDRARLHPLALEAIEAMAGGRAPEATPLGMPDSPAFQAHASDPFAVELAGHARLARAAQADAGGLQSAQRLYLRRASQHAENTFRLEAAQRLWQEYSELVEGTERAEALGKAGSVAQVSGRSRSAEPLLLQAVALHRASGNRRCESLALGNLASLVQRLGRIEEAEGLCAQALARAHEAGDALSEGVALQRQAAVCRETGRVAEALALFREVGDRSSEGSFLCGYARLLMVTGRLDEARRAWENGTAILTGLGDHHGVRALTEAMRAACDEAGVPFVGSPRA